MVNLLSFKEIDKKTKGCHNPARVSKACPELAGGFDEVDHGIIPSLGSGHPAACPN